MKFWAQALTLAPGPEHFGGSKFPTRCPLSFNRMSSTTNVSFLQAAHNSCDCIPKSFCVAFSQPKKYGIAMVPIMHTRLTLDLTFQSNIWYSWNFDFITPPGPTFNVVATIILHTSNCQTINWMSVTLWDPMSSMTWFKLHTWMTFWQWGMKFSGLYYECHGPKHPYQAWQCHTHFHCPLQWTRLEVIVMKSS